MKTAWPDSYVACDSTASILYRNNHDGTFTDVAVLAGAAFNEDGKEQAGMGATIGDFDGDGHLDIFKTNFSDDTSTLYRNNGNGTFDDVTTAAGLGLHTQYLGWGTMFFDFDNDGWPDLLLVNGHVYPEVDSQHLGSNFQEPRILYHNNGTSLGASVVAGRIGSGAAGASGGARIGSVTFTDISAAAGPGITTPNSSRGLAIGDLWNDGTLSAVISNMNATPSLLVNSVRTPNHWVAIKTVGTKSNRDGIGARIRVKIGPRCWSTRYGAGLATIPTTICGCILVWVKRRRSTGWRSAGRAVWWNASTRVASMAFGWSRKGLARGRGGRASCARRWRRASLSGPERRKPVVLG